MLTTTNATPEQIEKIYNKHLKSKVFHAKWTYDDEDKIGFIWCSSSLLGIDHGSGVDLGLPILEWEVRNGNPCFFSLQKGGMRWDIAYPSGKFKERLIQITNRTHKQFIKGAGI